MKRRYPNIFIINNRTDDKEFEDIRTFNYIAGLTTLECIKAIQDENPNNRIILDRFHISELVYGYMYRGYDSTEMMRLDNKLAEMGAKLVFLYSGYEHITIKEKKKEYLKIQEEFQRMIGRTALPVDMLCLDGTLRSDGSGNKISTDTINVFL